MSCVVFPLLALLVGVPALKSKYFFTWLNCPVAIMPFWLGPPRLVLTNTNTCDGNTPFNEVAAFCTIVISSISYML